MSYACHFSYKVLNMKTPYELLFGHPPSYTTLKSFGCLCYVSTHFLQRSKLDPRSLKCAFLGYTFDKKGYKVLDLNSKKILTSRDVVFHEIIFPFSSDTRPVSTDSPLPYFTPFHFPTDFGHSDSFLLLLLPLLLP